MTLVDTGDDTDTGGRLLESRTTSTTDFFMTYGDGVADVDLRSLYRFHAWKGAPRPSQSCNRLGASVRRG